MEHNLDGLLKQSKITGKFVAFRNHLSRVSMMDQRGGAEFIFQAPLFAPPFNTTEDLFVNPSDKEEPRCIAEQSRHIMAPFPLLAHVHNRQTVGKHLRRAHITLDLLASSGG